MLVAVIAPGLMDDPCDWDVCAEAAAPVDLSKLSSGTERKPRTGSAVDQAGPAKSSGGRKPEKMPSAPAPAVKGQETPRAAVAPKEEGARSRQQGGPARDELREALPKIPPLSSFKSCRPRFVALEEAELDFHSFISAGLGRSVDVIREFRDQEDGGPSGPSESVTLGDDSSECLKLCGKWKRARSSNPRSVRGSERNEEEGPSVCAPQIEEQQVTDPPRPKAEPQDLGHEAPAPQKEPPDGEASPEPEHRGPSAAVEHNRRGDLTAPKHSSGDESKKRREKCGKQMKRVAGGGNAERRSKNQEEERRAGAYWKASYRAWSDYYAAMSAFQSQGYQSGYGAAHSWMAAYRMNAVYMEELLKD